MKKLIIFFMMILSFGFEIKYKYHVKYNTTTNQVLKILKEIPEDTEVVFPKQKVYDFNGQSINLNKRITLDLGYSTFKNLNLHLNKEFAIDKGIFDNTKINITNVKKFYILKFYLNRSVLNINSSKGLIIGLNPYKKKNSYLLKIYKTIANNAPNNKININNSFVSFLGGNIFSPLVIKNSSIKTSNTCFLNVNKGDFIYAINSYLWIKKSYFYNKIAGIEKTDATFIAIKNSEAIIENSIFKNNWVGILALNSKSILKNNKFYQLKHSIMLIKNSSSYILNNNFDNAIGNYSKSILLAENSKAFIKENSFKNVWAGIYLLKASSANIYNNVFENLYKQYYKKKSYKGRAIYLNHYTFANIANNTLTSDNAYLIYTLSNTKYYNVNNIGDIRHGGDEVDNKLDIEVKQPSNFITTLNKIENQLYSELKKLAFTEKSAKPLQNKIYEGYLAEPENKNLIALSGGYEIEINNGTYLKIEKKLNKYIIVSPKEYKGIILDKLPPLKQKTEFKFKPHYYKDFYNGMVEIYFEINTNENVNKITFNNGNLTLLKTSNGYKTRPRVLKKFKTAQVVIFLDNKQLSYKCNVSYGIMSCEKMKKDEL